MLAVAEHDAVAQVGENGLVVRCLLAVGDRVVGGDAPHLGLDHHPRLPNAIGVTFDHDEIRRERYRLGFRLLPVGADFQAIRDLELRLDLQRSVRACQVLSHSIGNKLNPFRFAHNASRSASLLDLSTAASRRRLRRIVQALTLDNVRFHPLHVPSGKIVH